MSVLSDKQTEETLHNELCSTFEKIFYFHTESLDRPKWSQIFMTGLISTPNNLYTFGTF